MGTCRKSCHQPAVELAWHRRNHDLGLQHRNSSQPFLSTRNLNRVKIQNWRLEVRKKSKMTPPLHNALGAPLLVSAIALVPGVWAKQITPYETAVFIIVVTNTDRRW